MQSVFPIVMFGNHAGSVSPPALGQIILGTRVNYGNSGNAAQAFIESIGGVPEYSVLMEYLWDSNATWGTWDTSGVWDNVGGWSPGFTSWPGPKLLKVPMQVTSTPLTWTDVTGGGQDSNFTSFFTYCLDNGIFNLDFGWEGNDGYPETGSYPWAIQAGTSQDSTANQEGYVAVWQHLVTLARAVSTQFKFWWNPDWLGGVSFPNWTPGGPYYPGDSYVDVIGMDIYNTYNAGETFPGDATMLSLLTSGPTINWDQCLAYATAHDKALCVPEWGMSAGGANGGDDPTYINNTWNLYINAASVSGLTVYAMPWDNVGSNPISGYPNSLAALTSNVAEGVALGLVVGNTPSAAITRSTTSEFPLSIAEYPGATTTITGITLGNEGDAILVPILVVDPGGPTATVTASPANGIAFTRVDVPYTDASWPSGSTEIELWVGYVTAAAAESTISVTATYAATPTYTLMTVDELTSGLGTLTNWVYGTQSVVTNASSETLTYPTLTAASSGTPRYAYYGYLQTSGTVPYSGTNPINGLEFTYTALTTSTAQIAFNGALVASSSYAPVGAASVSTPSFGIGQVWSALAGSASQLFLTQVANQTGTESTPITSFSSTAAGGTAPYSWSIANQPTGISINSSTGAVTGTPSAVQTLETVITCTDSSGQSQKVNFTFTTSASSGLAPKYPPPGVTLAASPSFNSDFSTMANTSESAGPYFAPLANGANTTNNASNELANINIVNGQLVLTLSSGGNNAYGAGAFVTSNPATGGGGYPVPSNGGFTFETGYIEFSIVVPNGNWWALWVTNSTANSPYIEYDIAENGNTGAAITTTVHGPTLGVAYQAGDYPTMPAVGTTAYIGALIQTGSMTNYCNGVQEAHIVSGDNSGLGAITINNEPAFIILNIGSYEGPIPAYLKVNYVRVWALA